MYLFTIQGTVVTYLFTIHGTVVTYLFTSQETVLVCLFTSQGIVLVYLFHQTCPVAATGQVSKLQELQLGSFRIFP